MQQSIPRPVYVELPLRELDIYAKVRTPALNGLYYSLVWQHARAHVRHIGGFSIQLAREVFNQAFGEGVTGIAVLDGRAYRFYGNSYRPVKNWQMPIEGASVYEKEG